MTDYYQLLGVDRNANEDAIKQAYRKLAMKYHPDRGGDEKKFKEIEEAYRTLSNPQKKQDYDNPMPNMGQWHFHTGAGDINDLFSHFNFSFGGHPRRQPPKNRSVNINVDVNLEEVLSGKTIVGNIRLPSGVEQYIELKIPPGVKNGDALRFPNLGDDTHKGIPRGDLMAIIRELPHQRFVRRGRDLHTVIRVSIFDIITGGNVKIETLDKKLLDVDIPAGFSLDRNLVFPNQGLPTLGSDQRGNLYVNLDPVVPKSISEVDIQTLNFIKYKYNI